VYAAEADYLHGATLVVVVDDGGTSVVAPSPR